MRAVDIKGGKGGIDTLHITDVPKPQIDHAKALVKVKAFGLNRMDLLQREGMYPVPPQAPKTLGVEFSGTIEELAGESEKGFKKGDAVFGLAYGGAYAEYISVSTHMLVHKPDELSWEQAAGIPEVSCCRTGQRLMLTRITDLDYGDPGDVPDWRVRRWQIDTLARRRLCSLDCWDPTKQGEWRLCGLRHSEAG